MVGPVLDPPYTLLDESCLVLSMDDVLPEILVLRVTVKLLVEDV